MSRGKALGGGSILALAAVAALVWINGVEGEAASPPVVPIEIAPAEGDADFAQLAQVAGSLDVIDPHEQIPDYRRDSFGDAWEDIDGNRCRQRDDVLARDLQNITRDGCTVLSGVLDPDPYTGARIEFEHDRIAGPDEPGSQGVQIEHIVSLSAAHNGGAWAWTPEQRVAFANDLDHLIAVDGAANAAKSDRGPGSWLPENPDYVCTFAASYTEIVDEHDLAVEQADKDVLVDVLTTCAG